MSSRVVGDIGAHIQGVLAACTPSFNRSSPALFGVDQRDRPDLFASSVAVSIGGKNYLVTAAHAVWEIRQSGSKIYAGGKSIRPIQNLFRMSSPQGNDSLDLAIVEIDNSFLNSTAIHPIRESQLFHLHPDRKAHMRVIHGFPISRNKTVSCVNETMHEFRMRSLAYAGIAAPGNHLMVDGRTPKTHMALTYSKKARNEKGERIRPSPTLKGMSGGGLWAIPDTSQPSEVFLEGISIEHHNDLVLVTRSELISVFAASRA